MNEIESERKKILYAEDQESIARLVEYKLVKDGRTAHETGNVDAVMNGDLDGFIKAYLMQQGQKETKKEL